MTTYVPDSAPLDGCPAACTAQLVTHFPLTWVELPSGGCRCDYRCSWCGYMWTTEWGASMAALCAADADEATS